MIKHRKSSHPLYWVWSDMNRRCSSKNHQRFHDYGGRGIQVSEDFKDFVYFFEWCKNNGYKKGLEIDREDNNGNYSSLNCRFVTSSVNNSNKRKYKNNSSGYVGVEHKKRSFSSSIQFDGTRTRIGTFKTAEEASLARDKYIEDNNLPHRRSTDV